MTRLRRIAAEAGAEWRSFVRHRAAVFFTFFFPVLLIVIFGALVRTDPSGGGLFAEPPSYYVAGYIAVVVLFTPLSRVASTVARYRDGNRFEKLATTPLSRAEWLAAHTIVNVIIVGIAALLILVLVLVLTEAPIGSLRLLPAFVALGVVTFCGIAAVLGRITDSRDGAVAASNAIGFPLLFLSDTFVPPSMLPEWFVPLMNLSPLTYFARGARASMYGGDPTGPLLVLCVVSVVGFAVGAVAIPRTD